MAPVPEPKLSESPLLIQADLFVDHDAFDRFGRVLRHLLVGLVDHAVRVRLVSADPRVESLTLGPVTTVLHERPRWPLSRRRIGHLLDVLAVHSPTIVYALSGGSYPLARAAADAFDADLVFQVTSVADVQHAAMLAGADVGHYLTFTQPLATMLADLLKAPPEQISLLRPGVIAAKQPACFSAPRRSPTILSLASFTRRGGVEAIVEAAARLRDRHPDFLVFLLGEGPRETALRKLIRTRGLGAQVTMAHPGGNLLQTMHNADVYIRPASDNEFHDDVLHAMGAGNAVVVVAGPAQDYVRHGETGLICEAGSPLSLAAAIDSLLADRDRTRRIAEHALEYVRTQHPISAMADTAAEVFRRLAVSHATFTMKES